MFHRNVSTKTLFEAFQHQVESRPDATALLLDSQSNVPMRCSWKELAAVVKLAAASIVHQFDHDKPEQNCITHLSSNCDADVVIALAALALGVAEAPLDERLAKTEIQRRRNMIGGVWLDDEFKSEITSALLKPADQRTNIDTHDLVVSSQSGESSRKDRPSPENTASLILWTSGTTSEPRAVLLSAAGQFANATAKLNAVPQFESEIRLTVLPLSHAYARTCDFGTWLLSGCTLAVCLGYQGMLRRLERVKPNLINAVPSMASRMLREKPRNLNRLRLLGCGGAPLDSSDFERWDSQGVTVIQGYGLTEAGPVICSATPSNAAPNLVGNPVDGWETRLEDGQLHVRGSHTMLGYLKQADATAQRMTTDGWLATGDLVELDGTTGQFRILGRMDDVIILPSGQKIHPSAIEREMELIHGIQHAMLTYHQDKLQLWLNLSDETGLETVENEARKVLANQPYAIRCKIQSFHPNLSMESGELTPKGTIRRGRIMQKRFYDHAGS